jgi:hypothetical protein
MCTRANRARALSTRFLHPNGATAALKIFTARFKATAALALSAQSVSRGFRFRMEETSRCSLAIGV